VSALFEAATLFDIDPDPAPAVTSGVDWDRLDGLAFLYTATAKGTSTGIRFAASIADAQRWCSSDVSRGVIRGTAWAYMWTSASNYIRHHSGDGSVYGVGTPRIDLTGCTDNGEWDDRIAAEGVTKIALDELAQILRDCGVQVSGR